MRLVTIIRLSKDGVTGESCQIGNVSEAYSEEHFARRTIKQLREAKQELTAGLTAKRVADEMQMALFEPGMN